MATTKKKAKKGVPIKGTKENKDRFVEILTRRYGNKSDACKAMHISRQSVYDWMNADPDFKKKVDEVEEVCIDNAESALHKAIEEGNVTAIIFYLKTKGKKRGYVEQIDQNIIGSPAEGMTREQVMAELERIRKLRDENES